MPTSAKLAAAAYQLVLALTWILGHKVGLHSVANSVTRAVARFMKAPGASASMGFGMNHPYTMTWFGSTGGFKKAAKVREPTHPMLYFHGKHKPFQFQSPRWLAAVAARADSKSVPLDTGHWMMIKRADVVNAEMRTFLGATQAISGK
jgi:pimeloyl-ACP methyl ester carboxylesterase